MSDWFLMLGEPLAPDEDGQLRDYLRGLDLDARMPIETVRGWDAAGRAIQNPDWDRGWWDAEQRESQRLNEKISAMPAASALLEGLSRTLELSVESVRGAAAAAATRGGCADAALIYAAAGSLGQALYLAELARLAGESLTHAFFCKQALFAGGHWPLGIIRGSYYIF
jgi:hypothetical protein